MVEEECDYSVKVVVLGDSGVGKSCLLKQFAKGLYDDLYVSTIGVDFETKKVSLDGALIKLYLWDTAGQERFRNITRSYYRGADAVLLVYDVTDEQSFGNVRLWLQDLRNSTSRPVVTVLVGNKADLESRRVVSGEQGEVLAKELELPFFEASAKTSLNIESIFNLVAAEYLKKAKDFGAAGVDAPVALPPLELSSSSKRNKCCS